MVLQTHVLGPCNNMCELVRRDCAIFFQGAGVPYPPFFNCSLPTYHPADGLCFGPNDPTTLTYPVVISGGSGATTAASVRQSASSTYASSSLKIATTSGVIWPALATQILFSSSATIIGILPSVFTPISWTTAPTPTKSSSTTGTIATPSAQPFASASTQAITEPSATPRVTEIPATLCYPAVQVPFCANVGYEKGFHLPNPLGDVTPLQAENRLRNFKLFVDMKCSQALVHFLCAFYAPPCGATLPYAAMQPCRNLCEFVRKGCEPAFVRIGMVWPMQFACDELPDAGGNGTTCYGAHPEDLVLPVILEPPTSSHANGRHFYSSRWLVVSAVVLQYYLISLSTGLKFSN